MVLDTAATHTLANIYTMRAATALITATATPSTRLFFMTCLWAAAAESAAELIMSVFPPVHDTMIPPKRTRNYSVVHQSSSNRTGCQCQEHLFYSILHTCQAFAATCMTYAAVPLRLSAYESLCISPGSVHMCSTNMICMPTVSTVFCNLKP